MIEKDGTDEPQPTTPRLTFWMSRTDTIELWHPDSPGVRINVRPCLRRRVGLVCSPFATLGEVLDYYKRVEHYIEEIDK